MLSAQDVRAKTFEKAVFGGYEMSGVDDYLDAVAQALEEQSKEIAVLKGKLKILADKVEEYRTTEDAMRDALVSAKQLGRQIEDEARAKGEAIIADATAQSVEALSDIRKQIAAEQSKLASVQGSYAQFLSEARQLCERQIRYLDAVPQQDLPTPPPAAESAPEQLRMDGGDATPGDPFGATQLFNL